MASPRPFSPARSAPPSSRARSSLPFAIAGPDGSTAAVTATLVAALIERLIAEGAPDDLLAPVMIVLALHGA